MPGWLLVAFSRFVTAHSDFYQRGQFADFCRGENALSWFWFPQVIADHNGNVVRLRSTIHSKSGLARV
jgi:hypothetical protein